MSQLTTTEALLEAQHARFIKNPDFSNELSLRATDDGPVATVAGEEIPLLDMAFDLQVVQPGHVTQNKKLAPLVGKILVLYDKEQPEAEYAEEMNLMPITIIGYGQRNFGAFDEAEKKLLCYSNDGVVPADKVTVPMHHVCANVEQRNGEYVRNLVCPHAVWDGDKKPDCRTVVTLGFFDLERKIPVRLQLHGTGYGAWNQLQRAYRQARNVARLKKKSINDYIIRLSIKNEGTYMVPEFRLLEAPEEFGNPKDWLPICKYYMGTVFSRARAADIEPVEVASVSEAPELGSSASTEENIPVKAEAAQEFTID